MKTGGGKSDKDMGMGMGKIFDKLSNTIASIKKSRPAIGAALQGVTTSIDTLETQLQQMHARKPANQADLQSASSTVQGLKANVQALVSALHGGSVKTGEVVPPPQAPAAGSGGGT